jgi:aminopeptidase N
MLPDGKFLEAIREFAQTYNGKTASTWDFQHLAEKYAGKKLDWFFDDWVFGTGIPEYALEYKVESAGEGFIIQGKIRQSKVPDDFAMPVPLYADDQFLGSVNVSDDEGEFSFRIVKRPEKILIDPKGNILTFRP